MLTLNFSAIQNQEEEEFEKETRSTEWSNNTAILMLKKDEYTEKKKCLEVNCLCFLIIQANSN
jgi:hypothetical protein